MTGRSKDLLRTDQPLMALRSIEDAVLSILIVSVGCFRTEARRSRANGELDCVQQHLATGSGLQYQSP
jgi:hypothetical protein